MDIDHIAAAPAKAKSTSTTAAIDNDSAQTVSEDIAVAKKSAGWYAIQPTA
jgi:hypothetical protein